MSTHYRIEKDLEEAHKLAAGLDEYVRGTELYGSAAGGWFGGGAAPALTVGALALRLRRLDVLRAALTATQQATLETAEQQHRTVQRAWTVHYAGKVLREAASRLDAMRTFFKECADQPRQCPQLYGPELLRRTIVQELLGIIADQRLDGATVETKAHEVDGKLRGLVVPADFQWDAPLRPAYPAATFWWLYAAPPRDDEG